MGVGLGLQGWNDAMADYAATQRAAGRSPGTVRLHRHYLARVAELVPDGPEAVTTRDLRAFLGHPGWAPETRKSARAAVRGFYGWALTEGLLAGHPDGDPSAGLAAVRVPPSKPRPAPEAVLEAALRAADLRVRLMLKLAAYAGLRAGEIARVHARDLVAVGPGVAVLVVRGKGGRTRRVPVVHPKLLRRLELLEGWAFDNGRGEPITSAHVSRLVSRALPEGWTCHTLRHRMATVAYAGTRDLLAVGELLGHSRPETTQRYVLLPEDALVAAARAAAVA